MAPVVAAYIAYIILTILVAYGGLAWYGARSWRRLQQQPDVSFPIHMRWLLPETGLSTAAWLLGLFMSLPLVVFKPSDWQIVFEIATFIPMLPYYSAFWIAGLIPELGVSIAQLDAIFPAVGGLLSILLCLYFISFIEWAIVRRTRTRSILRGPSQSIGIERKE